MPKILVTGGAGFIGAYLVNKLSKEKKNKIFVIDNLKTKGAVPFISNNNKFLKGDITEQKILKKIEKWKPEIIFHLAAQSGSEGAYDSPKSDLVTNGFGTYLLAKLAKKINCKKFIYTSTVAVYGSKKRTINEKSNIEPDSIYGISKYCGELYILQLLKYSKVKTYIFRVFNTYGPGEDLNNQKKGMVSIFLSYLWKKKPIIVKGSLNRFRNFIYIDDCVNFLYASLKNKKLKKFEVFNLTSQKKYSVLQLIKKIVKNYKIKNYKIKVKKGTKGDSFGFHSSNSYLRKKFPKIKFTPLEEGLKKYVDWVKSLPNNSNLKNLHPLNDI